MAQLCDCEQRVRSRRMRNGIVFLALGLVLLAVGGWHVADFYLRPQLIGQPHNALGHWLCRAFPVPSPHSHDQSQRMFGQFAATLGATLSYYIVIGALVALGWAFAGGGLQLLWRVLKKEPQQCPHCGSTR